MVTHRSLVNGVYLIYDIDRLQITLEEGVIKVLGHMTPGHSMLVPRIIYNKRGLGNPKGLLKDPVNQ